MIERDRMKKSYLYFKNNQNVFREDPFAIRAFMERQKNSLTHIHEATETVFVISGTGRNISAGDEGFPLQRGTVFTILPGQVHGYTEASELVIINLLFDAGKLPPALHALYQQATYKQLFLRKPEEDSDISTHAELPEESFHPLETMLLELCRANEIVNLGIRHSFKLGMLLAILARLCDFWPEQSESVAPRLDAGLLADYFERHLERPLNLPELSRFCGMSPSTLLRYFHASFGETPMAYFRKWRLDRAANQLLNTKDSVRSIAADAGFEDTGVFHRAFKKAYGVTPDVYRRH